MALSSWAGAGWNEKGMKVIPRMKLDDIYVELSKVYLVIHDERAWKSGEIFVKPVVMRIYNGELSYRRLKIVAKFTKSPQKGLFFYIYDVKTERKIVGIGTYGFDVKTDEWVGIKETTFLSFLSWLSKVTDELHPYFWMPKPPRIAPGDYWYYNQGTLYLIEACSGRISNEELPKFMEDIKDPLL